MKYRTQVERAQLKRDIEGAIYDAIVLFIIGGGLIWWLNNI